MKASKSRQKRPNQIGEMASWGVYPIGSFSERADTRVRMYAELRRRSVPLDILEALLDERYYAPISWETGSGEFSRTPLVAAAPQPYVDEETTFKSSIAAEEPGADNPPKTAGEALALWLADELDLTRSADKGAVRRGKNLPLTTIAWVANDLLDGCRRFPPGPYLRQLIRKLLNVDRLKINQSKQFEARQGAIWIVAHFPLITSEEIANELGVNRSSVSRWRKEASFKEQARELGFNVAPQRWRELIAKNEE
ncbi:hypothetical protein JQ609_24165 [Bradyrhizobium sp. AUGA SZCCT0169]|uniref:hypothetical protein n=1 Tax=Bradyrhizobium sp. AUGA SZCCT0169 TaxID=2807663 RepID=UPI001BA8AD85|nr:hypothetical protein [Bradyrhizobium sp. AUGA SZCCT0169]MBR1250007.1 hypothetical protein [Bradyrhizobium sp. AUGA SZCCT0169]